jgi:iron complex outermembrane receptor protein
MKYSVVSGVVLASLATAITSARAQQASGTKLPELEVVAPSDTKQSDVGYAADPKYNTPSASFGPLGKKAILDTPTSITVIPEDLLANQQVKAVNDALRYLPSVQIRNQQGFEVSRPQARGFQGSVFQNTRLEGLNVIGTTAIPAENLAGIQVLNGVGGSLYGPETPAGVFNYTLKRPTDAPLNRYIQGFDANGILTEQADIGGRSADGKAGYRVNVVHGAGESYVSDSSTNRTLASGAFDYRIDDKTVIQTFLSHYSAAATGLPGSFTYDGKTALLPHAVDPTKIGFGQPGAGTDLITNTGLVKIKHELNNDWNIEMGALYQDAVRNLFGITNNFTNNSGDFKVTKNFDAVPHFTIASNSAYLNGRVDLLGFQNDLTFGTNGFVNGQYSYRNTIMTPLVGAENIANPVVLPTKPIPNNGGEVKTSTVTNQSLIAGDMFHFNEQFALQTVLNTSFFNSTSFNKTTGAVTGTDTENGLLSPTVSLIYKLTPQLTTYATFSDSVEQGETAPAGTVNVNQLLAPYRDKQYEVGVKYAVFKDFLVTLAAFDMTRPLASTVAVGSTNVFEVIGTQHNRGVELFAQGNLRPDLSIFGGVTYIDARLVNTGDPTTENGRVVGVPTVKSDIAIDYHPYFAHGFAFTGAVHYESSRAETNTNNSFASPYATLDLGLRYSTTFQKHAATWRFQVLNVTDTHYYSSIADGNIVGSPGTNTAYLGTPRVYSTSLEMDF